VNAEGIQPREDCPPSTRDRVATAFPSRALLIRPRIPGACRPRSIGAPTPRRLSSQSTLQRAMPGVHCPQENVLPEVPGQQATFAAVKPASGLWARGMAADMNPLPTADFTHTGVYAGLAMDSSSGPM
jgi:hypothetical protein